MGRVHPLEVPRDFGADHSKIGSGIAILMLGSWIVQAHMCEPVPAIAFVVLGLGGVLVCTGGWMLVARPPQLRATSEGIAFCGGAIVPWHEVMAICETPHMGRSVDPANRPRHVTIWFRRRATMLRMPRSQCLYWAGMLLSRGVTISTSASPLFPALIVARLEALRMAACGTEECVAIVGSGELPRARVIKRR